MRFVPWFMGFVFFVVRSVAAISALAVHPIVAVVACWPGQLFGCPMPERMETTSVSGLARCLPRAVFRFESSPPTSPCAVFARSGSRQNPTGCCGDRGQWIRVNDRIDTNFERDRRRETNAEASAR